MPDPTIPGFAPPRAYRTADYRRGCADMLLEMPLTVNRMCMEQADRQSSANDCAAGPTRSIIWPTWPFACRSCTTSHTRNWTNGWNTKQSGNSDEWRMTSERVKRNVG